MSFLRSLPGALFAPVDIASLVAFRICFGALAMFEVWRYASYGWVAELQWPTDGSCCFDFTGDGQMDNRLGELLSSVGSLFELATHLAVEIQPGFAPRLGRVLEVRIPIGAPSR